MAQPKTGAVKLGSLPSGDMILRGLFRQAGERALVFPPGFQTTSRSHFDLDFSHAGNLEKTSAFDVKLNDVLIGSIALTSENSSPSRRRLVIPAGITGRDLSKLSVSSYLDIGRADCAHIVEERPWLNIAGSSILVINKCRSTKKCIPLTKQTDTTQITGYGGDSTIAMLTDPEVGARLTGTVAAIDDQKRIVTYDVRYIQEVSLSEQLTRGFASGVTKEEAENEKIEKAEALTLASMMDKWLIVGAIFTLDSSSSSSSGGQGLSTIYNENLAGFHAGVRVRPFAAQSFVLYVLGGTQKDLRGTTQHRAKWFSELIAGVNGYWAWGRARNGLKAISRREA